MAVEYRPPLSMVSLAQVEWERMLPVPGQVLVRVGDKVEATDVIAQALQPGDLFAVDAARELGIGKSALLRYMVKTEGEQVREHDVLALRGGVLKKKCLSPVTGSIRSVVQGRILIEREPAAVELRALVKGEIARVVPSMGAIVRTTGALVRGAWGSGKESSGIIRLVTAERDVPLTPELLDASCHGAIVIGGSSVTAEAIKVAEDVRVRGIVAGGMDASLIEAAQAATFPVFLTQGMGDLPMLAPMFELFKTHQGREAVITQEEAIRGIARPELFIPLPPEGAVPPLEEYEMRPLEVGTRVVIMRPPYTGMVGQVLAPPRMIKDEDTGLQYRGVEVLLVDGRKASVPLTNLDLVEEAAVSPGA